MSFRIENDSVLVKYNDIWNKIKGLLGTKFHSMLVYDETYIKTKVKAFNVFVHTIFEGNEIRCQDIVKTLPQRCCNVATTLSIGFLGHFITDYSDFFPVIEMWELEKC